MCVLLRGSAGDQQGTEVRTIRVELLTLGGAVVSTHLGDDLAGWVIGDEEGHVTRGVGQEDLGETGVLILEAHGVDDDLVVDAPSPVAETGHRECCVGGETCRLIGRHGGIEVRAPVDEVVEGTWWCGGHGLCVTQGPLTSGVLERPQLLDSALFFWNCL